jgi:phospholipid-translocating ATPase
MAPGAIEPSRQEQSERSKPIRRIRWATHRVTGQKAQSKRESILGRLHHRGPSKRSSATETEPDLAKRDDSGDEATPDAGRRIFFNLPLPPDAKDEDGYPINHYTRNKIRTAKYTPLSFIPKNLWLQFHNIANMYFLFIIILSVGPPYGTISGCRLTFV